MCFHLPRLALRTADPSGGDVVVFYIDLRIVNHLDRRTVYLQLHLVFILADGFAERFRLCVCASHRPGPIVDILPMLVSQFVLEILMAMRIRRERKENRGGNETT